MINTLSSYISVNNPQPIQNVSNTNEISANTVPITKNFVSQISNSNRQNNNLHHNFQKKIYSPNLAPSQGSTTENFLKAKSLNSPIYKHSEMLTRYEMISSIPIKLYNIKKKVNLFL